MRTGLAAHALLVWCARVYLERLRRPAWVVCQSLIHKTRSSQEFVQCSMAKASKLVVASLLWHVLVEASLQSDNQSKVVASVSVVGRPCRPFDQTDCCRVKQTPVSQTPVNQTAGHHSASLLTLLAIQLVYGYAPAFVPYVLVLRRRCIDLGEP